jgi:branched-chain amino acid transport system substrate-binding protein
MTRALRLAAVVLLSFAIPVAAPAARAQEAPPIRIGTFLTASGDGAFLGAPALAALQMSIERINAQGGVLGRQLELVFYDTGLDVQNAQIAVQRLIDVDRADVIVGGSTTGAAMAVVPLMQQSGTPYISLASAVALVEPTREWVFKTSHTDLLACRRIFADIAKRGFRRVAVLSDDSGFGRSMRVQCLDAALRTGVRVIADTVYPALATDVMQELVDIDIEQGIDAIVNLGVGDGPVHITRTYDWLRMAPPLYQSHGAATEDYIRRSGRASEGVRLPASPLVVGERLAANDPQRPAVINFVREFKARWEVAPTVQSGYAYDALGLALSAIARARGTDDKARIRDELERTRGFIGVTGIITMSPGDHQGLGESAFRMVEIRNGNWSVVD